MCCARPWSLLVLVVAFGAVAILAAMESGAVAPAAETAEAKAAAGSASLEVVPVEESMHEFMEYVFEPGYKRLKVEMAKAEKDRAVWKAIKGDALTLAEASNLLLVRVPDEDGDAWKSLAVATRKAGHSFYQAARAADSASADRAWRQMLNNCNACHQKFAGGEYQLAP